MQVKLTALTILTYKPGLDGLHSMLWAQSSHNTAQP